MSGRRWSTDQEINLFSLVCDFKPAGANRDANLTEILLRINEKNSSEELFTEQQITSKLQEFFDLKRIEEIEGDSEEDTIPPSTSTRKLDRSRQSASTKTSETTTSEPTIGKSVTPEEVERTPEPTKKGEADEIPELYSSELSDVEGEETELEKLHSKELPSSPPKEIKKRGRPKKVSRKPALKDTAYEEPSTPASRKRTRLIVKDEDETRTVKRRSSKAQNARRKSKAEFMPGESQDSIKSLHSDATPGDIHDESINTEHTTPGGVSSGKAQEEPEYPHSDAGVFASKETDAMEEEPRTRRSTRQAARRSARNK